VRDTLAQFNSETGTIHRLDPQIQLCHPVGTSGIGTRHEHEYTAADTRKLEEIGRRTGVPVKW
jgi:hypothetical protein